MNSDKIDNQALTVIDFSDLERHDPCLKGS